MFAMRSGGSAPSEDSDEAYSEDLRRTVCDEEGHIELREKQQGTIGATIGGENLNDRPRSEEDQNAQRENPV